LSLSKKDGAIPPNHMAQDEDTTLADCERVLAKHHDRSDGAMIQIALSPSALLNTSKSVYRETVKLAE